MKHFVPSKCFYAQGDQIGHQFRQLNIIFERTFFEKKKKTIFSQGLHNNNVMRFDKKWVWLHFGRLFLKSIWSSCLYVPINSSKAKKYLPTT
jgi:hypothetical protein